MRKIAIYDSFTEPKHRRLIDETAARAGFTVDYYAAPTAVPADKRGDYEVIYGMPKPGELKDFVNLKWFCGSFAGVDAYLDDSLYPSPEVMLSNSSGAYGVTIAEHMVMVTLMLLRHAPAYCAGTWLDLISVYLRGCSKKQCGWQTFQSPFGAASIMPL